MERVLSNNDRRQWGVIRELPYDVCRAEPHNYIPRKVFVGVYVDWFELGIESFHICDERRTICAKRIRSRSSELFEMYVNALKPKEAELRYQLHHEDTSFLHAMVVDGWYLLLIMTATVHQDRERLDDPLDYDDEDRRRLFDLNDVQVYKCDMLICYNQIPLIVLERIVSVHTPSWSELDRYRFLTQLILMFFSPLEFFSFVPSWPYPELGSKSLHILDVYRNALIMGSIPYDKIKRSRDDREHKDGPLNYDVTIPAATKLKAAQIGIRTSRPSSAVDIMFTKKHILKLPTLSLSNKTTELVFKNLVWFERQNPSVGMHISSYLYIMINLVQDPVDSSLLKDLGIIRTVLHDDQVTELFKGIFNHLDFTHGPPVNHDLFKVMQKLRDRYNKNSEEWRKDLFQTYLKSPVGYISIGYAILVLVLTVLQTVYTMMGYYKGTHMSSYLNFMSNLVQEPADSNLLKDCGIISTMLHDDKVAEVFKEMCMNMEFDHERPMGRELFKVGLKAREQYNKTSEEWRKDLFKTYLRSLWAYISIGYAILNLVCSVFQTAYTIMVITKGK